MRPLILVGGGGHCKSVIEAAISSGRNIAGILEVPSLIGTETLGIKVIGTDDDMAKFANDYDFVITVGSINNCQLRKKLAKKINTVNGMLATIIASSAVVSKFASIQPGTVILHHATVNAGATIGENCIINTGAIIEHDSVISDFTHVSTAAVVNGMCNIGKECFIGSNSTVLNCVDIADYTIIGAGSVVLSSIDSPGTFVGNPAKKIK